MSNDRNLGKEERLVIIRHYISSQFKDVQFTEPSDGDLAYVLAFTIPKGGILDPEGARYRSTYRLNIPRALFDDNIRTSQLETLLNRQRVADHLRQHTAYSLEYPTFDPEAGP